MQLEEHGGRGRDGGGTQGCGRTLHIEGPAQQVGHAVQQLSADRKNDRVRVAVFGNDKGKDRGLGVQAELANRTHKEVGVGLLLRDARKFWGPSRLKLTERNECDSNYGGNHPTIFVSCDSRNCSSRLPIAGVSEQRH